MGFACAITVELHSQLLVKHDFLWKILPSLCQYSVRDFVLLSSGRNLQMHRPSFGGIFRVQAPEETVGDEYPD